MRPDFLAGNVAYSAIEDDAPVGFYVLTQESDGMHLDHLWIIPAAMGRGIGRALFEHAVTQARDLAFNSIKIEADPNAEAFYRHLGAVRIGTNVGEVEGERRELPLLEYRIV
jgi:GNAT superfamily N-acetyltransferase